MREEGGHEIVQRKNQQGVVKFAQDVKLVTMEGHAVKLEGSVNLKMEGETNT